MWRPVLTVYKDGQSETCSATVVAQTGPPSQPAYGSPTARPALWQSRRWLAGTESAREYGGYLEGALEAAEVAIQELLPQLPTKG